MSCFVPRYAVLGPLLHVTRLTLSGLRNICHRGTKAVFGYIFFYISCLYAVLLKISVSNSDTLQRCMSVTPQDNYEIFVSWASLQYKVQ